MIKNKIVLITGGNGQIGAELAKKIIDYNAKVVVVDKNKKLNNSLKYMGEQVIRLKVVR